MTEKGITCEIVRQIAVLSENERGYTKEINLVSWNGAEPKYDIRNWHPDREKCFAEFPGFLRMQRTCIDTMKQNHQSMPQCFGF